MAHGFARISEPRHLGPAPALAAQAVDPHDANFPTYKAGGRGGVPTARCGPWRGMIACFLGRFLTDSLFFEQHGWSEVWLR